MLKIRRRCNTTIQIIWETPLLSCCVKKLKYCIDCFEGHGYTRGYQKVLEITKKVNQPEC